MQEIEELKKHLKTNNFEMFCHVYNQCETSLIQYHDSLVIGILENTQLPLSKKVYGNKKKFIYFLLEKSPTLQLVCLIIAQKEDVSKYIHCFNSLDHLLFVLAAKDAKCANVLKYLDVQDDTLAKLILKVNFKQGVEWLQEYQCKNKNIFCIAVIATFLELLKSSLENNKRQYHKCVKILCSKGLDKELTKKILKVYVEEIKEEKQKIVSAILANQAVQITTTHNKNSGFLNYNQINTKKNNFYTPLDVQFYLIQSWPDDIAKKIYNFINLSKILPDKLNAIKINKI